MATVLLQNLHRRHAWIVITGSNTQHAVEILSLSNDVSSIHKQCLHTMPESFMLLQVVLIYPSVPQGMAQGVALQ